MRVAIGVFAEPALPGRCAPKLLAAYAPAYAATLYAAMLRDTLDGLLAIDASEYLVFPSDGPPRPPEAGASARRRRVLEAGRGMGQSPMTKEPHDAECTQRLARELPSPWEIVNDITDASRALHRLGAKDGLAILASGEAPSAPTEPLADAVATNEAPFVVLGAAESGLAWLLAMCRVTPELFADLPWKRPELVETVRAQCAKAGIALVELPPALVVDDAPAVGMLLEELRRHPERAPRAAQFLLTHR